MHYLDLRRSNAVYIFQVIKHIPKSIKEISIETEMAEITVKKIVYKLIDAEIVSKGSLENHSVGRPIIYISPNPINYSLIIVKTDKEYVFNSVNTYGERKKLFDIPTKYQSLDENKTLKFAYDMLKKEQIFKYCHSIYLIGEGINKLNDIDGIIKATPFQLIASSLLNTESTIYLQFGKEKALINHGRIKSIDISKEELSKIIDIDEDYTFNDLDETKATNEALRIITLNKIEEKVAQLFS